MRQKRNVIKLGAIFAIASLTLVGCTAADESPNTAPDAEEQASASGDAEEQASASGDIVFWSALGGMDKVTEVFNESQDEINVTFEEIPNGPNGGYAKIAAAVSAGDGPDVAGIEYYALPQFVTAGALLSVGENFSEETTSKFSDAVMSLVTLGDSMYGLPYDAPPQIAWYRSDVLEAAGVGVPETWEDFEAAAIAVKEENPNQYLASFFTNDAPWFAALSAQAGAEWFAAEENAWNIDIAGEETEKVASYWQSLIDRDLVKAQGAFGEEWTSDLGDGTVAGALMASWSATSVRARTEASGQEDVWIAAQMPNWGTPATSLYGGTSFAVTRSTENPAAAAKFIEFLTTDPEAIRARGDIGSAFLAVPELSSVSAEVFDSSFFANDIWAEYAIAYDSLVDWSFGPSFNVTSSAITDNLSPSIENGTLLDALPIVQDATLGGLALSGLSVK